MDRGLIQRLSQSDLATVPKEAVHAHARWLIASKAVSVSDRSVLPNPWLHATGRGDHAWHI